MILVGPGKADGILRTSDRQSRFDHLGSLACDGERREIDEVQSQARDAARSALRIDWADPKVISPQLIGAVAQNRMFVKRKGKKRRVA